MATVTIDVDLPPGVTITTYQRHDHASLVVVPQFQPKSADSLWSRLILDLNRGKDMVRHTIGQIQELVAGFRAIFSPLAFNNGRTIECPSWTDLLSFL